ncbi:hypothetical protein MRY87_06975 [bacterium]|nr:hypothetical protein [bacterium]
MRLFFLLNAVALSFAVSLCAYVKELPVLPQGPAVAVSEVTKSIWERGSLTPEYFQKTYEEARAYSEAESSYVWQDVFAIDSHGNLLPKHSLISAILAVPFFALLGPLGFWAFQQLVFLWLLYSTYLIVEELTHKSLPWTTLLATFFLSQSIFYSYQFSYDLHGCALLIGGLYLMRPLPFLGAMVMSFSVFTRPTHFLLLVPLALARNGSLKSTRVISSMLGIVATTCLFLLTNYYLFGNPFLTSYQRLPVFHNGEMILLAHPFGFNLSTFVTDWPDKLFGSNGLVLYNLSFAALPLVLVYLWRCRQEQRFQMICLLTGLGYSLYIFSYPMWSATSYGNRFLLPAVYLYLFSFIPFAGQFESSLQAKSLPEPEATS